MKFGITKSDKAVKKQFRETGHHCPPAGETKEKLQHKTTKPSFQSYCILLFSPAALESSGVSFSQEQQIKPFVTMILTDQPEEPKPLVPYKKQRNFPLIWFSMPVYFVYCLE